MKQHEEEVTDAHGVMLLFIFHPRQLPACLPVDGVLTEGNEIRLPEVRLCSSFDN